MSDPDFNALESLVKVARQAYYDGEDTRFSATVYMLKLMVEDLKDASRSIKGGVVHPTRTSEVQTELIRADREADRPGDPSRFHATWIAP